MWAIFLDDEPGVDGDEVADELHSFVRVRVITPARAQEVTQLEAVWQCALWQHGLASGEDPLQNTQLLHDHAQHGLADAQEDFLCDHREIFLC